MYTNGLHPYTNNVMNLVDPGSQVFKRRLYQNACYLFEIPEEDVLFVIKDISRFKNRNIKRSVLIDPKPQNFMMTPDNTIPIQSYTAEDLGAGKIEDDTLLSLIDQIE